MAEASSIHIDDVSNKESYQLLNSLKFCIIDLETTGGNHKDDEIIEIGLVKVESLSVTKSKNFLVNPQKKIPDFIQKLTSIKQEDVVDCPTINEIIDEVTDFIGDDILVAHNSSFDVPFLNSVLKRLNKQELENKVICTNIMTKYLIPEIVTSNLSYMSRVFNIEHNNAHRASDDAKATAKLLLKFLKIFIDKGISKVNQLYYPRNKFELDRIHFKASDPPEQLEQFIENSHDMPTTLTLKGERGIILAIIPFSNIKQEKEFLYSFLKKNKWEIATFKLTLPLLDGLMMFINHYPKLTTDNQGKIHNYLMNRYSKGKNNIQEFGLVITPHLVRDQVVVYNIKSLNFSQKNLFKIPGQKKKLNHYIDAQVSRLSRKEKVRKNKLNLTPELQELLFAFLNDQVEKNQVLHLTREVHNQNKKNISKLIESFIKDKTKSTKFPERHF